MTRKQFIKRFVPREKQVEAGDNLENLMEDYRESGYTEALKDVAQRLNQVAREVKFW